MLDNSMNTVPEKLGDKLLVAMSNSPASLNLVQIVADQIPDLAATEVTLMHYLSPIYWEHGGVDNARDAQVLHNEEEEIWQEEETKEAQTRRYFEEARKILIEAGVPAGNIHMKWAYDEPSVTDAILDTLESGHYTAVVVGRHHHNHLEHAIQFSFTDKIRQYVGDITIWVVNDEQ